jgi:hypothetical protein
MRHGGKVFVVNDLHGLWVRDARSFEKVPVLDAFVTTGEGFAIHTGARDKPRARPIQCVKGPVALLNALPKHLL